MIDAITPSYAVLIEPCPRRRVIELDRGLRYQGSGLNGNLKNLFQAQGMLFMRFS